MQIYSLKNEIYFENEWQFSLNEEFYFQDGFNFEPIGNEKYSKVSTHGFCFRKLKLVLARVA